MTSETLLSKSTVGVLLKLSRAPLRFLLFFFLFFFFYDSAAQRAYGIGPRSLSLFYPTLFTNHSRTSSIREAEIHFSSTPLALRKIQRILLSSILLIFHPTTRGLCANIFISFISLLIYFILLILQLNVWILFFFLYYSFGHRVRSKWYNFKQILAYF